MEELVGAFRLSPVSTPQAVQSALAIAVCAGHYDHLTLSPYTREAVRSWRQRADVGRADSIREAVEAAFVRAPHLAEELDKTRLARLCIRCNVTNGLSRWAHVLLLLWLPLEALARPGEGHYALASQPSYDALARAAGQPLPQRDQERVCRVAEAFAEFARGGKTPRI